MVWPIQMGKGRNGFDHLNGQEKQWFQPFEWAGTAMVRPFERADHSNGLDNHQITIGMVRP